MRPTHPSLPLALVGSACRTSRTKRVGNPIGVTRCKVKGPKTSREVPWGLSFLGGEKMLYECVSFEKKEVINTLFKLLFEDDYDVGNPEEGVFDLKIDGDKVVLFRLDIPR